MAVQTKFQNRGMRIDWKRGKSGLMIALAGRHARTARRELFRDAPAQLTFDGPSDVVCLDDAYRHLGGV
eukprot:14686047-Heterocapsa_arctica.AAC.1